METTPLFMMHNLTSIPSYALPDSYKFRLFGQEGDDYLWARILVSTNEYADVNQALERFQAEFVPHRSILRNRILFLETTDGQIAGSAVAWFGEWQNETIGRLHWVGIKPEFQGQGLGRPLIIRTMEVLKQHHSHAFLKTQAASRAAMHLYRKLGWYPVIKSEEEKSIWEKIQ